MRPSLLADPFRRRDFLPYSVIEAVLVMRVWIPLSGIGMKIVVSKNGTVGGTFDTSVIAVSDGPDPGATSSPLHLKNLFDVNEQAMLTANLPFKHRRRRR